MVILPRHRSRRGDGRVGEQQRTRFIRDGREEERQQEEAWREAFEATAYQGSIERSLLGRDFKGWTSMYDGAAIDRGELNEWLDDTLATLQNGGAPGNVMEVGTGSGMILFNLLDGLQSYVGLEPAASIVHYVRSAIPELAPPGLVDKIQLHVGTGADLGPILGTGTAPDLVVVNSVAQYFPGADYLLRILGWGFGITSSSWAGTRSWSRGWFRISGRTRGGLLPCRMCLTLLPRPGWRLR